MIDGLLGIGVSGALEASSPLTQALKEAAALVGATVVAVDLPSGMNPDTGNDEPKAFLPAHYTVTFGARKPVHVLSPARDACGQVTAADIGFPAAAVSEAARERGEDTPYFTYVRASDALAIDPWSALPASAHKYDRGHVLIIGGSPGKSGAPLLAATAALRAGAGWASVAMAPSAAATLAGDVPRELTFEDLFSGSATDEVLDADRLAKFLEARKVKAVVIGPGTMGNPMTPEVARALASFTASGGFVVLDAGATHDVLPVLETAKAQADRWLLTPHPGEWTRLDPAFKATPLSLSGLAATRQAAVRAGVTLIYKHATPVLVSGSKTRAAVGLVMDAGSIALARAGSGDVYAGVAGAHGAIGLDAATAGLRAQAVVASASKRAADDVGLHAVLASDVVAALGHAGRSDDATGGWEIRELGKHD